MKQLKRKIPDDVVLVICSVFTGMLWLWTQQSGIYTRLDFYIYFGAFAVMICAPMFYSGYVKYKQK